MDQRPDPCQGATDTDGFSSFLCPKLGNWVGWTRYHQSQEITNCPKCGHENLDKFGDGDVNPRDDPEAQTVEHAQHITTEEDDTDEESDQPQDVPGDSLLRRDAQRRCQSQTDEDDLSGKPGEAEWQILASKWTEAAQWLQLAQRQTRWPWQNLQGDGQEVHPRSPR